MLNFPTTVTPLFLIEASLIFWSIALFWVREKLAMRAEIIAITCIYFLLILNFVGLLFSSNYELITKILVHTLIFGFVLLRIVVVLIPTGLTFLWEYHARKRTNIQTRSPVSESSDEIWEMLRDEELRKVFRRYAEQELSHENVLFYEAMLRFKATKNKKNRREMGLYIFHHFIREDAILGLNLNRVRRRAVATRLNINWEDHFNETAPAESDDHDSNNSSANNSPLPVEAATGNGNNNAPRPPTLMMMAALRRQPDLPDDIFDDVVKDVKNTMQDTFARFTRSTMYHQFVKETELRHNILTNANII